MREDYPRHSWHDPRLERRPSPLSDFGVFAAQPLRAGEALFVFGGVLMNDADLEAGLAAEKSVINLREGVYLGHLTVEGRELDDYINHSCCPNAWMLDEVTVAARRDIAADEEITLDYAFYLPSGWVTPWVCACGEPECRERISGDDWQNPVLQQRYRGHFSPFVQAKIDSFSR